MSTQHLGNTQPAIDQEEHTHVSSTAGKKVFVIDDSNSVVTDFGGEKLPTTGNNASLVLAYDGDGNLSTLTKTIGASQYQKTLTYTAGVLSGMSFWVEI